MSFLLGPISGAVIAGGVYYGFSTMIHTSTEKHIHDLRILSRRLEEPNVDSHVPSPAFDRIRHRPFSTTLKHEWNSQLESLFHRVESASRQTAVWGRQKIYGEDQSSSKSD